MHETERISETAGGCARSPAENWDGGRVAAGL
nr:MAG TPA: hypothetical protein [Caudoviricetes sp.]